MIDAEKGRHFQTYTVGSVVGQLTIPPELVPVRGTFTNQTGQIRYTYHEGGAPTTTAGHVMDPGDAFTLEGTDNIRAWRHIATGATNGELSVTLEAL